MEDQNNSVMQSRRRLLFGTASTLTLTFLPGRLYAQTPNANEILRLYGRAEPSAPGPDLQFIRQAQEARPAVPITLDGFNAYLENLPLMEKDQVRPIASPLSLDAMERAGA